MYQKTLDQGEKFTAAGMRLSPLFRPSLTRRVTMARDTSNNARRGLLLELRRHREGVVEAVADREQP